MPLLLIAYTDSINIIILLVTYTIHRRRKDNLRRPHRPLGAQCDMFLGPGLASRAVHPKALSTFCTSTASLRRYPVLYYTCHFICPVPQPCHLTIMAWPVVFLFLRIPR